MWLLSNLSNLELNLELNLEPGTESGTVWHLISNISLKYLISRPTSARKSNKQASLD